MAIALQNLIRGLAQPLEVVVVGWFGAGQGRVATAVSLPSDERRIERIAVKAGTA